jgi:hypothetical protein
MEPHLLGRHQPNPQLFHRYKYDVVLNLPSRNGYPTRGVTEMASYDMHIYGLEAWDKLVQRNLGVVIDPLIFRVVQFFLEGKAGAKCRSDRRWLGDAETHREGDGDDAPAYWETARWHVVARGV